MSSLTGEMQTTDRRSVGPGPTEQYRADEEVQGEKKNSAATARLKQSWYMVILTLIYVTLALYAWITTCILTFRPITVASYGYDSKNTLYPSQMVGAYEANQRWLQSARVIQAVVAVLTIPLTSAICSRAAVVYVQERAKKGGLTLRQTMTLGDRGWTDITIYARLLLGQIRRYGTRFLLAAIVLNILGALISPLQSVFLTIKTIKAATGDADWGGRVGGLNQISDLLDQANSRRGLDDNLVPVLTRSAITSASLFDPQARLWTGGTTNCSGFGERPFYCDNGGGGISLANLSVTPDPYLAQLPAGYNTGVMRQFLPRINSSGTRERISEGDFPADCEKMPKAFYAHYDGGARYNASTNDLVNWSVTACMPGDQTKSPWSSSRSRQDFSEYLYLNISTYGDDIPITSKDDRVVPYYLKIALNTTAGYFELPNYMNGQRPGSLLKDDFTLHCGVACKAQTSDVKPGTPQIRRDEPETNSSRYATAGHGTTQLSNATVILEKTASRGPLLNLAISLFGNGSFLADRVANPRAFITPKFHIPYDKDSDGLSAQICISQVPLLSLLEPSASVLGEGGDLISPCISNGITDELGLHAYLAQFVSVFWSSPTERVNNVLSAAAFMTNEVWLTSLTNAGLSKSFSVVYDQGVDTQVPVISIAGIIVVSVLLGIYLTALLTMAVYGSRKGTWTEQLDTFAMIRIGAAIADQIALKIVEDKDKLRCWTSCQGG